MKVALVCDWLTEKGGAEKVLLELSKMFPDAPIYTSQYRKGRIDWFKDKEVKTGYLDLFPVFSRRLIAPLRQNYFKNLNLKNYDLVISVTGCDAKFIETSGYHLCYCHVPTQYYWGKRKEYLKNPGFGLFNPFARIVFRKLLPELSKKDFAAAKNPDAFITISDFAKAEIKRFYKREAKVVSPPVETEFFAQAVENYNIKKGKSQTKRTYNNIIKNNKSQGRKNEQKFYTELENVENLAAVLEVAKKFPDGFYLNFSRQVNWKRLDLVVNVCKKLNLPLVLVGSGPESKKLQKLAHGAENILFLPFLSKSDLRFLASQAKAFVFPSKEPFGIAPVEALAAGCPVVALKSGGALDFIKNGKNGLFFTSQTEKSLEKALKKIEKGNISLDSPKRISASVQKFSSAKFAEKMQKIIENCQNQKSTAKNVSHRPKKVSVTQKFTRALILSLPLILFFSNFPVLKFADLTSMHLELSLPLAWLLLFSLVSVRPVLKYLRHNLKTPLLFFPLSLVLSLVTSSNLERATLTFGVIICLFISVIGLRIQLKRQKLPKNFRKVILFESCLVALFCLMQSFLDALGIGRDLTLLCPTCTSMVFGFPHPNGFAIEPQFMGSLLIAPLFLAYNSLLENNLKKSQEKRLTESLKRLFVVFLLETTLFFTFSRGAIFSTLLGLFFLALSLKKVQKFFKLTLISAISLVLALVFQGFLATIGPTNLDFFDAVTTSAKQLTLGRIGNTAEIGGKSLELVAVPQIAPEKPIFTGYVAESTNRRLELSAFALEIAFKTPKNTIFGTGLGSAGKEMYRAFPSQGHEKEIVQNEYLEVLLELGLFGLTMLILSLITFIKLEKFKFEPYTLAMLLAYAVSLLFFSGLPNALHIYLIPVLWYNLMYDKNRLSRV